jgi:hypothetical protein
VRQLRYVLLAVALIVIFGASAIARPQKYTLAEKASILAKFGPYCTERYYVDPNHSPNLHYCSAYITFSVTNGDEERMKIAKISTLNLETGELTISSPADSPPRSFWPNPYRVDRFKVLNFPHMKEEI